MVVQLHVERCEENIKLPTLIDSKMQTNHFQMAPLDMSGKVNGPLILMTMGGG